jgi:transposase
VWHSAWVSGSELQRPSYDDLVARVVEQDAVISALLAEVAELRRRLGMDSSNSSKPPSSDGLDRTRRSGSGSGRRGKPRGAPGATRMLVDDPDERITCRPGSCGACAGDLAAASVFARQRRQVIEVPPAVRPHVTEYLVESLLCGGCGEVTCGEAPDGVAGRLQYGPGAKARMVYLRGAQYLPFTRAAHALGVLCGLRVAPATVLAAVREAVDRLGPFVDRVRVLLRAQRVIGADEAPAWVDGGWRYVHVACTDRLTLLHAGSRSSTDIDAGGVLAGFTGVLVRDGYAGYDHITTAIHAECGAHYSEVSVMPTSQRGCR